MAPPQPVTLAELTEAQVHAIAREVRDSDVRVVAVAGTPRWTGPEVVDTDGARVRVVACPSVLAARVALVEHDPAAGLLVLVTDRDERDLGSELIGAVWKRRLVSLRPWDALVRLFRAEQIAPAFAHDEHRWMVAALVAAAPARGYSPPPGGLLTVEHGWLTLLRRVLRLDPVPPTLADLVRWAGAADARVGESLDEAALDGVTARLDAQVKPPAGLLVRRTLNGGGANVVPVGVVAGLLARGADDAVAVAARARLEQRGTAGLALGDAVRWGTAAEEVLRAALRDLDGAGPAWLERAEQLLDEVGGGDLAAGSDLLPSGFLARLRSAGTALSSLAAAPSTEGLTAAEGAVELVQRHQGARSAQGRVDVLLAALRLARRAALPAATARSGGVDGLAVAYRAEGAWVDDARARLDEGETIPELAAAYGVLAATVDLERDARDRAFAAAFAAWSSVGALDDVALLGVERVLDVVVGPLAQQRPVLLLVVDGLSLAASHRFLGDLCARGWLIVDRESAPLPAVAATVPSITRYSRASLLSGALVEGTQEDERASFAAQRGLGLRPVLFHKRDLAVAGGAVAPAVRDAVLRVDRRVVGVVVNGVDDHLAKGGQLRLSEGVAGVPAIGWLADAASEAQRTIVLVSDHGHVLERSSRVRVARGGGERWRPAGDADPSSDEVAVHGPRVLAGGGSVIVPVVEGIRYNPDKKHGYHGGLTPAEVLCALTVLAPPSAVPAGWAAAPQQVPSWWSGEVATPEPAAWVPAVPPVDVRGQPVLFGEAVTVATGWLDQLLGGHVLAEQRRVAGRAQATDEELAAALNVLVAARGVLPEVALSRALDIPAGRLRGKLDALKRLLNVDAYEVLAVTEGTVRLDIPLLKAQFGVVVT